MVELSEGTDASKCLLSCESRKIVCKALVQTSQSISRPDEVSANWDLDGSRRKLNRRAVTNSSLVWENDCAHTHHTTRLFGIMSDTEGPKTVKKAKSAFLFYQGDNLSKIRAELGTTASMGDAMTEVSLLCRNACSDVPNLLDAL